MIGRGPERPSSRPGMLRPLAERRGSQPPTTLPGWGSTWDLLMVTYHNKPEFRKFVRSQREVVKEFYDARFDLAQGKTDKLNSFIGRRLSLESADYDPEMERLVPVFDAISNRFPGQIDPDRPSSPKR